MAIHQTPQGLPYPDDNERVQDVPEFIQDLAEALDKRIVTVYANQAAAYRKFKRPFRVFCWIGGGRASPVLGTDRTSVSGISASRGHAAALSAAMLR